MTAILPETPAAHASSRWSRVDVAAILALAIASFLFFRWYVPRFRAAGGEPMFYQAEFAPAAMMTCGRGFVAVDSDRVPALSAFLRQHTDSFRCEDIPPNIGPQPLNGFQGGTRYLMMVFSWVWSVTGISWRSADLIMSAFAAATVAGAYAALRNLCGRTLSLAVTFFWSVSPRHLRNVPNLHDYSKAPFFAALLVAIGLLFIMKRPRQLVLLGIAFGAVQGIGFGMRTDMAMNFVPFLLVLFAASGGGWRNSLKTKITAAGAALLTFASVSFPIVRSYATNSSLWHVVLLGLTSPFDENLNLGFPRPAYRFPYAYNDRYIQTVIQAYSTRVHPTDPLPTMVTRPYDRVCREYFFRLVRAFPGDMATRATASAVLIADLPFRMDGAEVPQGIADSSVAARVWRWRAALIRPFAGLGLLLIGTATLAVGAVRWRYAVVALTLFWFWAAVPALEFHERHTFHLELAVFAAIVSAAVLLVRFVTSDRAPIDLVSGLLKSAAIVAAFVVCLTTVITVGRSIQKPRAAALINAYAVAPATDLSASAQGIAGGQVRLAFDLFHPATQPDEVQEAMVRADLNFAGCGRPTMVNATFEYAQPDLRFAENFSHTLALGYLGPTTTTVFLPVYAVAHGSMITSRFVGLDVPGSFAPCVRLSRVVDPGRLGLIIPVVITPDWPRKLYARLRIGPGLGV